MKILYVEDEIAHVELTQRTLEETIPNEFELIHAETMKDALDRLAAEPDIDLILSDLRLPDGSGLDLLRKALAVKSPPAVVLVTGQGDQEVAVEALKSGAADYLVKQSDYLHRLPVVISNAVAQQRLVREQAALREAEIKYQSLVEQIPAVVFLDDVDENETTLYISPRIEELTGYTPDEWRATPEIWIKCIHPDDRERIVTADKESHECRTRFLEEYRIIRRDGRVVWVKEDSNPVSDKEGNPLYWQGILLDITKEKEDEAALQRQLSELAVLQAATAAGTESYSEDAIVETVTNILARIYPEVCGILLVDGTGKLLVPHSSYLGANVTHWQAGYPITEGITGRAVSLGRILRFGNVVKEPGYIEIAADIKSELSVPIRVHERVIGVINVESRQINAYGENDEKLLSAVADSLGTALERLRLFQEQGRRSRIIEALADIANEIATTRDILPALDRIAQRALELLNANDVAIYLLQDDQASLKTVAAHGVHREQLLSHIRKVGDGITGNIFVKGKAEIIHDTRKDPRRVVVPGTPEVEAKLHTLMSSPLILRGKPIGVINAWRLKENGLFNETELTFLVSIAHQVSICIESGRLFQETTRQGQEAAALAEVGRDISATLQLDMVMERIASYAMELLHAESSAVYLADAATSTLRAIAALGADAEAIKNDPIALGAGILGNVALQKAGEIVNDTTKDSRVIVIKGTEINPLEHIMGAPILMKDQHTGLLAVWRSGVGSEFEPRELTFLTSLARQAAVAIENARLYQSALQSAERRAVLHRISQDIVRFSQDSEQIYAGIHEAASRLMPCDVFLILLHDEARNENKSVYTIEAGQRYGSESLPGAKGLTGIVISEGKTIIRRRSAEIGEGNESIHFGSARYVQSVVAVPMRMGDKVIGMISAQSYEPYAYDVEEQALLEMLATHAATAIQNARLYDETQRRLGELEAINRLSISLRTTQNVDEMLEILLTETFSLIKSEHGAIWLYDSIEEKLIQRAARGGPSNFKSKAVKPGTGSIVGHVFLSGNAYISTEFLSDPLANKENLDNTPPGLGGVCIPIQSTAGPVGVMIISTESGKPVTGEARLLSTLAEITGNAIHRAQLFGHAQQQVERLTTLRDIDTAIASSFDLRLTLKILMEQAIKHLGMDAVDIALYHSAYQSVTYLNGPGFRSGSSTRPQTRIGEGLAGQVILKQKTYHVINLQNAPEIKNEPVLKREGFVTYIGIPLVVKGQTKGVFEIFHRSPLSPTPDWMEFLRTLAGQAAIAIDNSQLFENLQRSNQELMQAYDTTLEGWARALELRDRETEGHTRRVTDLTLRLAKYMGFSESEMVNIHRGVLLHDIGKMGVPDQILRKTGELNAEEWREMRQHPVYAYELLAPISFLREALDIPYCHHEHWDGSGYPRGLKGEQIPLAARIFSAVDIWDALLSDRSYGRAWPRDKVKEYIRDVAGTILDPTIVEIFLSMIERDEAETG